MKSNLVIVNARPALRQALKNLDNQRIFYCQEKKSGATTIEGDFLWTAPSLFSLRSMIRRLKQHGRVDHLLFSLPEAIEGSNFLNHDSNKIHETLEVCCGAHIILIKEFIKQMSNKDYFGVLFYKKEQDHLMNKLNKAMLQTLLEELTENPQKEHPFCYSIELDTGSEASLTTVFENLKTTPKRRYHLRLRRRNLLETVK